MKEVESSVKPSKWEVEPRLLPIKFVFFWGHAAIASLIPFFVTYYHEWGLTATELSIIQASVTFFSFFVRPVVGRISDQTQCYRIVLILCYLW